MIGSTHDGQLETTAQAYALSLLTEECGEVLQLVGKAGRFGIDTPGVKDARTGLIDMENTPRTSLVLELGDLMAAIDYACARGLVAAEAVQARRLLKATKLLSSDSVDNLGRRLAP